MPQLNKMSSHIYRILNKNLSRCSMTHKASHSHPSYLLVNYGQRRFLSLQEYQSKQILHENGIKVQRFKIVSNQTQVRQVLFPEEYEKEYPLGKWSGFKENVNDAKEFVIKAQVLAGGRGKGQFLQSGLQGGVKLTKSRDDAEHYASMMLGDKLVTNQTSKEGVLVERVMIAEAVDLKKEYYLAIVFDRSYAEGPILVTSPHGGMDIEEVAEKNEMAIRKFTIPIDVDLDTTTANRIAVAAFDLKLTDMDIVQQCADQIMKLHKLFLKIDSSQIEINPLGVTSGREVVCVDAKINFDENARFRQRWLDELEMLNKTETDSRDFEARQHNLNFIGLQGSIGCLVNGAGLAMATMDIIKLHGGEPANFLDVGGGASVDQVKAAFSIISSDENVKAIFVNIFGGIMRCDTVAKGIVEATKSLNLNLPIVVRLEGTMVEEAKEMIKASQLNIVSCDDFETAAKKVIRESSSR